MSKRVVSCIDELSASAFAIVSSSGDYKTNLPFFSKKINAERLQHSNKKKFERLLKILKITKNKTINLKRDMSSNENVQVSSYGLLHLAGLFIQLIKFENKVKKRKL
jgi:hypothetical protein